MEITKKIIGNLEKCYSLALLHYNDVDYFLVAAEKKNKCLLFDLDGNEITTVWNEPGGVMSMVQIPESNGEFIAVQKFYSPNDSAEAYLALVSPNSSGEWTRRKILDLPFVHRFDILRSGKKNYLIACSLKSAHEYKDDWRSPGKIFVCELPEDLSGFNENHQLQMSCLQDGLLRNHGYYRVVDANGNSSAVVSCANGIFHVFPPTSENASWQMKQLTHKSASDAALVDFQKNGKKELAVLSPFHGEEFSIMREIDGVYKTAFTFQKKLPFLHALFAGEIAGKNCVVVGNREGERDLLLFSWNAQAQTYECETLDTNCGSANVLHFVKDGIDFIVSANREINEIALYKITV